MHFADVVLIVVTVSVTIFAIGVHAYAPMVAVWFVTFPRATRGRITIRPVAVVFRHRC